MAKQVLRITIDKTKTKKVPTSRIGRWWYWNVTGIWWLGVKSKFYGGIYNFMRWLTPKSVLEKWDKEWEEEIGGIEVVVKEED